MQVSRQGKRISLKTSAYFSVIVCVACGLCLSNIRDNRSFLRSEIILSASSFQESSPISSVLRDNRAVADGTNNSQSQQATDTTNGTTRVAPHATSTISEEPVHHAIISPQQPETSIYTPKAGGVPTGILSNKSKAYFDDIRFRIDGVHVYDRCRPYSFLSKDDVDPSDMQPVNRRIFFGSLLADEPWELLEIVAAETYEIFEGMVFVESNRTQHFHSRPLQRVGQEEKLKSLFGTNHLQVRTYVNEDGRILDLAREHEQRQEILHGWKQMGMTADDVGYIADADETFTRDFLRAIQQCPDIKFLDYNHHRCHPLLTKVIGASQVFEASPDCIAQKRTWHHPDMIIGACIELIGNENINPVAPRESQFLRAKGYGDSCEKEGLEKITDGNYPLYSAADFRRVCGGQMVRNTKRGHTEFSAFHFHNFFANFNQTRFKYKSYGHPQHSAYTKKLEDMHQDLELVSRCIHNVSNSEITTSAVGRNRVHLRVEGGLMASPPYWPVYFHDDDYRRRKYESLRHELLADEISRQAYTKERQEAEVARRANLLKNFKLARSITH